MAELPKRPAFFACFQADSRLERRSIDSVPWWAWLLIAVGVIAVVSGVAFRNQLRFAMKLTKALATDERLPRPLRGAIGIALAIKVVPVPDFGVDEIILVVVGALLLTVYRATFRQIVIETRDAKTDVGGESRSI
jgi:uncharacterized membrane protein YdcZ (DUF606 family)